jgi:carbon storage regulator
MLNTIKFKHYNVDRGAMNAGRTGRQWNMLILTRRRTEAVVIGDNVTITVLDIKGGRVRIGVNAPREIIVNREEILEKTRRGHRMPHVRP